MALADPYDMPSLKILLDINMKVIFIFISRMTDRTITITVIGEEVLHEICK